MNRTMRTIVAWVALIGLIAVAGSAALADPDEGSSRYLITAEPGQSEEELYNEMTQARADFKELVRDEPSPRDEAAKAEHTEQVRDALSEIWRATTAWCSVADHPQCF